MTRRVPWWQGVFVGAVVACGLLGAKGALLSSPPDTTRPTVPVQDASVSSAVADPSPSDPCAIVIARVGDHLDDTSTGPTQAEIEHAFADRPGCLAEWRKNSY